MAGVSMILGGVTSFFAPFLSKMKREILDEIQIFNWVSDI
jgi:predicted phage tail protein